MARVALNGEYQVVPTQSTQAEPGQKLRGWLRAISGLPKLSGTQASATGARGSAAAAVATGGIRSARSRAFSAATSPPRRISAVRRQARLNCLVVYARPRGRPFSR